jgi:hypothetical protein
MVNTEFNGREFLITLFRNILRPQRFEGLQYGTTYATAWELWLIQIFAQHSPGGHSYSYKLVDIMFIEINCINFHCSCIS